MKLFFVTIGLTAIALSPCHAQVTVGANVRVSREHSSLIHIEPLIAADPSDPARLLACAWVFDPGNVFETQTALAYTSSDSGKSWTLTFNDKRLRSQYPTCAYGPRRTAYIVAPANSFEGWGSSLTQGGLLVYRSIDSGKTWLKPVRLPHTHALSFLATDRTGGKYDGRVYVAAFSSQVGNDGREKPMLSLSTSIDGGASFRIPVQRVFDQGAIRVAGLTVLADGTVAIATYVHTGISSERIDMITSSDGGETLSPPSAIFPAGPMLADISSPTVDASRGPFRNRLYVAWGDDRSGRYEIYLSHSNDKAKTWSKPRVINDDREWPAQQARNRGPDHGLVNVAVNKDGVVGVLWYDRRDIPREMQNLRSGGWYTRFRASLDGGETWLPSVRVAEHPRISGVDEAWWFDQFRIQAKEGSDEPISTGVYVKGKSSTGHTIGLCVDGAGVFHTLWVDNRTGLLQLWTAPITVTGVAIKNGSRELAEHYDISNKVTLDYSYVSYERTNGVLTVTAKLTNKSKELIGGPIKIRLLSLGSQLAAISVVNAQNGMAGEGAIWDFTQALPSAGLAPGASTSTQPLVFRLTDLRHNQDADFRGPVFEGKILKMDVRVLAADNVMKP